MIPVVTSLWLASAGSVATPSQLLLEIASGYQGSPQGCALNNPDCGIGGTSLSVGAGIEGNSSIWLYGVSAHGEVVPFNDDIAYYTAALRLPVGLKAYNIRFTVAPKLGFARHNEVVGTRTFFDPVTFEVFGSETYKTLMLLGFDATLGVVFGSWSGGLRFEAIATSRPALDLTQQNLGGGARLGGWLTLTRHLDLTF